MKKFSFTLQSVLDLALSTEKQLKIQYKRIEERLIQLQAGLMEIENSFARTRARYNTDIQRAISPEKIEQYGRYFDDLAMLMTQQKEKIARAEREKEKNLGEQVKTRQEIKTLEKLRESQYAEYLAELKKEQEKEIGDLVSFNVSTN